MIEKGKISQEPFIEILKTLEEAESANLIDWNAMNIASVDQMSQPSSRMVLLKKYPMMVWCFIQITIAEKEKRLN